VTGDGVDPQGPEPGEVVSTETIAAEPAVFVHPQGLCESDSVGPGTRVWAFAHVLPGAVIGRDCNICGQAFVEGGARIGDGVTVKNGAVIFDGVTLEDDVFVGPCAVFTNDLRPRAAVKKGPEQFSATLVQRGATIGANATVVCGVTIREHAFVAAGAVVIRDVLRHALMAGNPARWIGWVCTCGERLDVALSCSCGRQYAPSPDGSGLEPLVGDTYHESDATYHDRDPGLSSTAAESGSRTREPLTS
jgi:UDP-2-acetamido-3-amino-2,3-dideoxy-glucuronate N-acetyltransferase